MGAARFTVGASLAACGAGCTLWYLASDPYTAIPEVTRVATNVGAITVYADTLYANVGGNVYTCANAACDALAPLIEVTDGGFAGASGISADSYGIAWNTPRGIFFAGLDGGVDATVAVTDTILPSLVALDGRRVSYTLQPSPGVVTVRTCADVVHGCSIASTSAQPNTTVPSDAGASNAALASASGEIVWVTATEAHVVQAEGGAPVKVVAGTSLRNWDNVTTQAAVASDGVGFYYGFGSGTQVGVLDSNETQLALSPATFLPSTLCLSASGGVVTYCTDRSTLWVRAPDASFTSVTFPVSTGASLVSAEATSTAVFALDSANVLYRAPR